MSVDLVTSPSGRYQLAIHDLDRTSRGVVTRVADGTVVCDLTRNYGMFHHTFVTKDDREYLIAGRSYMSQTIVDLDRGMEYEPPGEQEDGSAFIWTACFLSPDGNTLAVDGCVWACPYELKFFDFTDPAEGWPELPIAEREYLESPSDALRPTWIDARTIDVHQHDRDQQPSERTRLERRGDAMIVVEHWVSDAEQERRAARARHEAELDAWWATFRVSDPLYLRLVELVRVHALPGDTLAHRPGARKIVQYFRRAEPKASADLYWDIEAATVRVQLYDALGAESEKRSFDATVTGIEAAIAAIVAALS
jgi:hypothetical protein